MTAQLTFRCRLEFARSLRGLTMAQLAALAGFKGRANVWHYESGPGQPTVALVERLARALGVDAVWLSGLPGAGKEPTDEGGR